MKIQNPILPGFNPDPSICRVGGDYYIATSTFEWFPGVCIYHSTDLANWQLIRRPLDRVSQLDMRGVETSGGIWAPCLSYCDGKFYLIYTIVKNRGAMKDTFNYLVTATDICGEWSEPIFMNATGFDPSLFHDDDGKKWFVNMQWDYRGWKNNFAGILLQQYDHAQKKLVGEVKNIFLGTHLRWTEAPHLYKHNGMYYLMVAEGGTTRHHATTLARSKNIDGPYEVCPHNPIITTADDATSVLQNCGHASICDTSDGEWYMVHLCARPIPSRGLSPLGRETAIQKVKWADDGWLYLENGTNKPDYFVDAPRSVTAACADSDAKSDNGVGCHSDAKSDNGSGCHSGVPPVTQSYHGAVLNTIGAQKFHDDFDAPVLNSEFQTLRIPLGENLLSLTERKGYLRLKGAEMLNSSFDQSFAARRVQAFCYTAKTCVEFNPKSFKNLAGLILFYDTADYYYLRVSHDDDLGKCISIISCNRGTTTFPLGMDIAISGDRCYLQMTVRHDRLQFSYSTDGKNYKNIGPILDSALLSDEHSIGSFTGTMVGVCCQDGEAHGTYADFDYFSYEEE